MVETAVLEMPVETHSRASVQQQDVSGMIMDRLNAFDAAIGASVMLEIDGLSVNGKACDEITQESRVKVLNHPSNEAYEVQIDTIMRTPLEDLILALETGEFMRCFGITRIN